MPKLKKHRNRLLHGDCLDVLGRFPPDTFTAVVTDPPYGLKFMGKQWDHGVPGVPFWEAVLRVAKPGAMLLAFGGTRTYHRMVCAVEDAGWEVRDCLMWIYGCLSEDTEILVDGRWEPYHRAIAGRRALCYNAEHDTYSWQPIQDLFVYDYADTAFRIQSDSTDQIVSRNHRCLVEQGGSYAFRRAETLERQASVPVLEDVQNLLGNLPVPDGSTSNAKQDLLTGVCCGSNKGSASASTDGESGHDVRGVRETVPPCAVADCKGQSPDVFQAVQRSATGEGVGQARSQGAGRLVSESRGSVLAEDAGREQSRVEGRCDVLPQARELQARQVRALPAAIPPHGTQGRLHHGAPAVCCSGCRPEPEEDRGGASRRPRSPEQQPGQPATLRVQSGAQTARGSRYTRADLARITPFFYRGVVWCVRVPTGAFVARRNGKVFVTGNSGFPKSLDISKAIDKTAGAEREVVGKYKHPDGDNRSAKANAGGYCYGQDGREWEKPITAPATPLAQLWDGYGTSLKPAFEPVTLAMKPLDGTFAANAEKWGVAGLWIDGARVGIADDDETVRFPRAGSGRVGSGGVYEGGYRGGHVIDNPHPKSARHNASGRWPANILHDGSAEVVAGFPESTARHNGVTKYSYPKNAVNCYGGDGRMQNTFGYGDSGSAARFFYCAKASSSERRLDGFESIMLECWYHNSSKGGSKWEDADQKVTLLVDMEPLPLRAIDVSGVPNSDGTVWSTTLFGNNTTAQSLADSAYTTVIKTSSTIKSKTLNWFLTSLTNGNIAAVSGKAMNGGSHAGNAGLGILYLTTTSGRMASALGVDRAVLPMRLKISASVARSTHPTVKPIALMRYLLKLVSMPRGNYVLDPFCGSGSTLVACKQLGLPYVGIDSDEEAVHTALKRLEYTRSD